MADVSNPSNDSKVPNIVQLKTFAYEFARKYLDEWSSNNDVNILSLVQLSMSIVENVGKSHHLNGKQKYELFIVILPSTLDLLAQSNLVTPDDVTKWKKQLEENKVLIDQTVDLLIYITGRPELIQAKDYVEERVRAGCLGRMFRCGGKKIQDDKSRDDKVKEEVVVSEPVVVKDSLPVDEKINVIKENEENIRGDKVITEKSKKSKKHRKSSTLVPNH